jgi:hypothetical protein
VSPNVPEAPRGKAQNKRPALCFVRDLRRGGPSTRGAMAPQRAQQVNFVLCRCRLIHWAMDGQVDREYRCWLCADCFFLIYMEPQKFPFIFMRVFAYAAVLVTINCGTFTDIRSVNDEQKEQAKKAGLPAFLLIDWKINSASGVSPRFYFFNFTNKDIKYATFSVTAYNDVGDKAKCSIQNKATMNFNITGPINPENSSERNKVTEEYITFGGGYEPSWYNATIGCLKLDSMDIEFMDGKKTKIQNRKELQLLQGQRRVDYSDHPPKPAKLSCIN